MAVFMPRKPPRYNPLEVDPQLCWGGCWCLTFAGARECSANEHLRGHGDEESGRCGRRRCPFFPELCANSSPDVEVLTCRVG